MDLQTDYYDRIEKQFAYGHVRPIHYGFAILAIFFAVTLRMLLHPVLGNGHLFVFFYPAVIASAWLGGLRPGLLATALATGMAFLMVQPFAGPLRVATEITYPLLTMFIFSSLFASLLMDFLHNLVKKLNKAHIALYEQHEWFRTTLTSIGDAVIVTDRNGTVTFMNGEAERLTGWTYAEAKKQTLRAVFRIINEESRKSVDDPVEKVFREDRVVGLANHTLLISKAGVEWPIEDSASPIHDEKRNIIGVVLVFHDATELRRNQRALKARADELEHKVFERTVSLQRTVNDLEAFSYTVSHDLRSPLRAMLGYSEALLEDFPTLPQEAKDYLQKIGRSAHRLDRLIQDLLAFSRLSHEDDNITSIDLDRLMREMIQQYPDFQQQAANISIEGTLPLVLGHETALTQVISNLIGNALKFIPEGRKPRIRIFAETHERDIRVWFIDNGIGIALENQDRIFKMFEQINPPGKYGGTGIGLAVVKKAVERMHGSMGVESTLGDGSKFWIELLKPKR